MLEIASKIVICLLIAALIGFIIGYILGKGQSKKVSTVSTEVETETKETVTTEEKEVEEVQIQTEDAIAQAVEEDNVKPELLTSARNGGKDKLTEIKGIGPKVEEKLNETGIYHFDQIASWTDANIKWLEIHTTFAHRAIKDLWVIQAKSL